MTVHSAIVLVLTLILIACCTIVPGFLLMIAVQIQCWRGRTIEVPTILGPVFRDEMTKLARRGLQNRLRALYAGVLLVALFFTYWSEFKELSPIAIFFGDTSNVPIERMADIGESFFVVYAFCQLFALTLITPVYAGSSIIEERDRRTLDDLRTTQLTNREIILGKFTARLVYILGVALTGLPILTFAMLFGGVDGPTLVFTFAVTILATMSLAAYAMWQATRSDSLRNVLLKSYTLVFSIFAFSMCCASCTAGSIDFSPISQLLTLLLGLRWQVATPDFHGWRAVTMLSVHGIATFGLLILAMGNIRTILLKHEPLQARPKSDDRRWEPAEEVALESLPPPPPRRERPPIRYRAIPRLGDFDPFIWKERYFGSRLPTADSSAFEGCGVIILSLLGIPFVSALITGTMLFVGGDWEAAAKAMNPTLQSASAWMVCVIAPLAGIRMLNAVARERQQQTLISLFTLPVERERILRAKLIVGVRWLLPWAIGYGAVVVFCTSLFAIRVLDSLKLLAVVSACMVWCVVLGLWFSVRCENAVRAATWYVVALLIVFVGVPVLLSPIASLLGDTQMQLFSPAIVSWVIPKASIERLVALSRMTTIATFVIVVGLLSSAWVCWRLTRGYFEREGRE